MRLAGQTHSLRTIHHQSLARLLYATLTHSYAAELHNNSLNCNNSRHYINPRNTLVNLNTTTKRLYLIIKTRLLSSRIHAQLTNSPLPPQEATTRQAAVSHDDSTRSLGDPGPLSATCFAYNIPSLSQ